MPNSPSQKSQIFDSPLLKAGAKALGGGGKE